MNRTRTVGAAVLSIALLLSACGGNDTKSKETKDGKADTVSQAEKDAASQADKDEAAASDNIDKYFELVGADTESSYKEAASLAAPDSVAYAYAMHLMYVAATNNAAGYPVEPEELPKSDKGFKVCDLNGDDDDSDCAYYSDLETTDGKIASFSANDIPLKGRVVLGTGDPIKAGDLAAVRFLSAYQSPFSDTLFVNVEVKTSGDAISTGVGSADYRRPNGRQVTTSGYEGDYEVDADSLVTNYMMFPGSEIGGEMSFDVNDTDYAQTQKVKIKTK